MTLKRLILIGLTVVVLALLSLSLFASWRQPQVQSRLELYQTNLLLHASEWQGETADGVNLKSAREALVGEEPLKTAQKQYQEARKSAQTNLEKAREQLQALQEPDTPPPASDPPLKVTATPEPSTALRKQPLQASVKQLEQLLVDLDLRLGVLQVKQGQTDAALKTWTEAIARTQSQTGATSAAKTAAVLVGLWSDPPRLLPDAQQWVQKQLDGWFRYQALTRLYQLQQRSEALAEIQTQEQEIAEQAFIKLAIVGAIPTLGFLVGVGLLIFLLAQRLLKGKEALLAQNEETRWSTPWNGEIVWQVFILGFFGMQLLVSLFVIPLGYGLLNLNPATFDVRTEAFSNLVSYILVALGALLALYYSIKSFFPLPTEAKWFRINWGGNWFWWGLGGYFVALPLVIVVSLVNQQIWQGQGGSNRLLFLALEGQDGVAIALFFLMAAVAAPLFEEFLFRGFLLPSLTRYMPVWGAILTSSLLFAVVHLSLSEVLPLATLGIVLGVVYTRSRNLLAPMLLHSLWNGGTLLSLFLLGSAAN